MFNTLEKNSTSRNPSISGNLVKKNWNPISIPHRTLPEPKGLITGQCVRKNSERAFQLYKSMIRSGYHPSKNTLEMLISTFCKNDDFDGAVEVLQDMLERRITPDSVVLSELHSGLSQCGKDDLAMKLLNKMETGRLLPEGFDKTTQSAVDQTTGHQECRKLLRSL
ncbi:hypothetical protein Pint_01852 [Pistacia integerrima]|uniref:Uncharacterized protein n=1 Tax=Pistacia integerrima TaxID=434235 RepID=A0ACC0ZRH7_9ROSI|nr:hypothetical protein Pint_01852 [Pistacia integerrima]